MSSTRKILLITENKGSEFSEKVIKAASASGQNLWVEPATFSVFSKVIDGEVSVVVLDHDELGSIADHFFRAMRVFHSHTPVLIAYSKKILLEQLVTRAHERNLSESDFTTVLKDAIELDEDSRSELDLSYSFQKDISLKRLADLVAKSHEFDSELAAAMKLFRKKMEERQVNKLVGDALSNAIDEIRREAFSSPVFSKLRKQIEINDQEKDGKRANVLH